MNLYSKQVTVALLPVLVVAAFGGVFVFRFCQNQILLQADLGVRSNLHDNCERIAGFFEMRVALVETLAYSTVVRSGTRSDILDYLGEEEKRLAEMFEGLYLNNLDGVVWEPDGGTFSILDRDYYPRVKEGETVVTQPMISRATGNRIVLILVPILDPNGTHVGAIGAAIRVEGLLENLEDLQVGERGFSALTDDQGKVFASGQSVNTEHLEALLSSIEMRFSVKRVADFEGEPYFVYSDRVAPMGWTLFLLKPETEVLASVYYLRRVGLSAILLALVSSFSLAIYSTKRSLLPLREILSAHQDFASGKKRVRVRSLPPDEIGELGVSFNRMALDLEDREERERGLEEARLRTEQLLQGIVNSSPSSIYVKDLEGKYELVNQTFSEIAGSDVSSLKGKTDFDVFPVELAQAFLMRDRTVFQDGNRIQYEEYISIGGWQGFYLTTKYPLTDSEGKVYAVCAISTDITEKKKTEIELQRLATAIEQALESVILTDPEGEVLYVNPAFESTTGYSRAEILGRNMRSMGNGIGLAPWDESIWQALLAEEVWTGRTKNRRKNGSLLLVQTSISVVTGPEGSAIGYACLSRDVTEHEELEAQLRESQKMEAVGQLAGGIAHDFNNLLQAIEGYTGLALLDESLRPDTRRNLEEVLNASDRAATLVRQLLTFSRRDRFKVELLNLNEAVQEMASLLGRVIGEHIELEVSLSESLPLIEADRGQVEQILMNLCVNSRDAMPDGGTIIVETGSALFNAETCRLFPWARPGHFCVLSVTDRGTGIAHEIRERIFEPFFTTKEVGSGTGLGLATVYAIVHRHHGFIHLYSEVNRGTVFRVYFPVHETTPKTTPGPRDSDFSEAVGGTGVILLAEDDKLVRDLAIRILERSGYEVIVCRDGEEAVEKFGEHRDRIQLALLDVVMPKLGGRGVYERIRESRSDLPVVFSSGYSFNALEGPLSQEEYVALIQKPYSAPALLRTVREMLDRKSLPGG